MSAPRPQLSLVLLAAFFAVVAVLALARANAPSARGSEELRVAIGPGLDEAIPPASLVDGDARSESLGGDLDVALAERVAVPGPAPARADDAPPDEPVLRSAVSGVVLEADGRPVADATVWLTVSKWTIPVQPVRSHGSAANDVDWWQQPPRGDQLPVQTDPHGRFYFQNSVTAEGGRLQVQSPTLLDEFFGVEVDPTLRRQTLRLPETPNQGAVWTVDVVDQAGRPVEVQRATLRFLARTGPGSMRPPRPEERSLLPGRVVQRGLAPARWELALEVEGSLGGRVEWVVDAPDAKRHAELAIERFERATIDRYTTDASADGRPWVDATTGLLAWLPKERLALNEQHGDRMFAATLRSGYGPVLAAELTLQLRAAWAMSDNDSLSLEFYAGQGFAWSRRIQDLVRARWRSGASAELRLDLARLPLADGGTFDLRPALVDGLLDVLVEDDTAVEGVQLRVVR